MSYTLADYKWGAGKLGQSGGVVPWSFARPSALGGAFASEIINPLYQELIRDAFQAWENSANIQFVQVADGSQSQLRLGWDNIDGPYGVVGNAKSYFSKLSATASLYTVQEAEIRFDLAESWATSKVSTSALNFYTTALHEIGHTMGLLHTDDPHTIMYPTIANQIELTAHDILGAQTMYGARLSGTTQNDMLTTTAGSDTINGHDGLDTVRFEGAASLYTVTDDNQLNIQVQDAASGITRELQNIERLQFDDGYLAFDTDGNAGTVYRLYQATFDRTPDAEGLGFWLRHFDAGTVALPAMADYFLHSQEFTAKYGQAETLEDSAYLTLLYGNILDRAPDQAGFDFWLDQQNKGLSQEAILQYFSDSQENIAKVAPAIDDGIWYV